MFAPPSPAFQVGRKQQTSQSVVAVAIDNDKGSQSALRWTVDTVCQRGQNLMLIHVKLRPPGSSIPPPPRFDGNKFTGVDELDQQTKDLFLPYRVFCTRKDIQCFEVVLENTDVAKALVEYVKISAIEILSLGAGAKASLFRFKVKDIPGTVLKGAPDFCSVYVISKGKISTSRSASQPAPPINPLRSQNSSCSSNVSDTPASPYPFSRGVSRTTQRSSQQRHTDFGIMKSPFTHRRGPNGKPYELPPSPESDITYVNSGRPSIESSITDDFEFGATPPRFSGTIPPRLSGLSDCDSRRSFDTLSVGRRSGETSTPPPELVSYTSLDSDSSTIHDPEDQEAEMQRLKKELKQTIEMYSVACKEALTAKQKALELQHWKAEEQRKLEETRSSEEAAREEKPKSKAAFEQADAAQRISDLESQKRLDAERKAFKEAEERNKNLNRMNYSDCRYRRYTIEEIEVETEYFSESRKIGEGGYGPVYKCYLDHTPAAVKVLRPDAAQGRSQFQQEVEVLSCIRHPNMVLLLGACPEYGCLVYEYMSNGSLEDRLMQKGKTPPLSWQHRFRIAAEITRGLLFLHQTKPEPIVHRDLKPGNILLDRNLVSKISDVGLARLVPPDDVMEYRTSTAGTFCYIDPEYQQTGMLGVKSDVYSLGIIYLQILTAQPAMGLTHQVERSIENGSFSEILDPSVSDWPVEEALSLAEIALQCSELRRKDRPDLGKVVMPKLERLRELSEESSSFFQCSGGRSPYSSQVSVSGDENGYPTPGHSGYESSRSTN